MDRIVLPSLPEFALSDEEIDFAVQVPIEKEVRKDFAIQPDAHRSRPRETNRILAHGIATWEASSGIPLAQLIKTLLLLYFTGQLGNGVPVQRERRTPRPIEERETDGSSFLYLEDVDTTDELDSDYTFG